MNEYREDTAISLMTRGDIDGKLEVVDVVAAVLAMLAMVLFSALVGGGLELLIIIVGLSGGPYSLRGLTFGIGMGLVMGGILGFLRLALDLMYGRTRSGDTIVDDYEEEEPADAEYGVQVEVRDYSDTPYQIRRGFLLDEVERSNAALILRKLAVDVLRSNKSFSKRKAGKHLGESLPTVRQEMERLGLVIKEGKAANSTYKFTDAGKSFLGACLLSPFPRDPIVVEIPKKLQEFSRSSHRSPLL